MTVRTCIFFLAAIFCFTDSSAQDAGKAEASVSSNKILIGEQILLTIHAQAPTTHTIRFPTDSLPHFEVIGKPSIDTLGENNFKAIYRLTSFDSGHWVIPSFTLAAGLRTDTLPVDVVFSNFNPDQPYHDITDVIDVPLPEKKPSWWIFIVAGVLAILVFYLVFRKKGKVEKPASPLPKPVNAYEEAMRGLQALQGAALPVKEFYSSLTEIFRMYVYRTNGILSMQKTTDDLVVQLRSLQLEKTQFEKLSQALRMSDFVKFARYVPMQADNEQSLDAIRNSVMQIEQQTQYNSNQPTSNHQ